MWDKENPTSEMNNFVRNSAESRVSDEIIRVLGWDFLVPQQYTWWILLFLVYIIEPVHEISKNVVCATSKASDQPAQKRSLMRAFASRLSILWLLSYWLNAIWSF